MLFDDVSWAFSLSARCGLVRSASLSLLVTLRGSGYHCGALQGLCLSPRALSEDLVQVEGHGLLGDQVLHLVLQVVGEDAHQGLGREAVLGALLVVTLEERQFNTFS